MSNVRNAVARRNQAAAQASAVAEQHDIVRGAIDTMSSALADLLPEGMSEKRFGTLVVSACKATPDLLRCFETKQGKTSVLLATVQLASMGLEPSTMTEEAYLLPRRIKGVWECQPFISYKGYLKLAYRSPRIASVDAAVVWEADHFIHRRAIPTDVFEHEASTLPRAERGGLTHAYCLVRYLSGGYKLVVLDREQVEKRRESSDSYKADLRRTDGKTFSPWNEWTEEQWLKTVVRASRAYFDLTPQLDRALATDGQRLAYDQASGRITATIEGEIEPEPAHVPELGTSTGAVAHDGPAPRKATADQLKAVNTLLGAKLGAKGDARFFELSERLDRPIESTKELTFDEAGLLIETLGELPDKEPPYEGPGSEPFTEGGAS